MIRATSKVIKETPWWQKMRIGSAAVVTFSAAFKEMRYFFER